MVSETGQDKPRRRSNARVLLERDTQALEEHLGKERGRNLLMAELNTAGELRYLRDTWATYWARQNQVWLTNRHITASHPIDTIDGVDALTDLRALPPDCLFLTRTDSIFLRPAEGFRRHHVEWTAGVHTLWAPRSNDWAVITSVKMPLGTPDPLGSVLWLGGNDRAEVVVLTARDGTLQLKGSFIPGPSLPETGQRTLEVETEETECLQRFVVNQGMHALSVPVRAGVNRLRLRVVETPTVAEFPDGDKRPLMLAIGSLSVSLTQVEVGPAGGRDKVADAMRSD
jgi:hypothetical protein